MSLNFSDLGGYDREIRCIVVQSFNKKIKVYYDNFEEVKEKFGNKVVTIYEPDDEQRGMITDLLIQSLKDSEENDEEIKINATDFIVKLLSELTDLNLNLSYENEEDLKKIEKILSKPTRLLRVINTEITDICSEIFDSLYTSLETLAERPEGMRNAVLERLKNAQQMDNLNE